MKACFRYESEIDLSNENNSQTQVILLTGKNKRVLEAGPATGYVTRVLKERGCSVTGIEIDEQAAAIAEPFCTRMIVGDIEKIDLSATFGEERFDVVIYGDVLEHLVNPDRVLENTRQILAPGGCVVASIPNVAHASLRLALLRGDFSYTDLGLLDRTHLRFYTRESLAELFRNAGYAISDWKRIVLEPFDTEQGLREEDFPAYLVRAIREDEDALTYQFVVKATVTTAPAPSDGQEAGKTVTASASLKSLWSEHERTAALDQQVAQLSAALEESTRELIAAEQHAASFEQRLIEAEQHAGNLGHELNLIRGSIGYRILQTARAPIRILAPPGSPQRVPLVAARRAVQLARRRGPMALVKKVVRVNEWPALLRSFKRPAPTAQDLNTQYQIWLGKYGVTPARAERLRREAAALTYRPLVSIVTPVYNPEVSWLRDTIESVRGQVYSNWELCLADDGSTKPGVRDLLEEYSRLDSRIKVSLGQQNGGISAASNAALALSTGEFVGLLDHDDVLTPDAVFEVVRLLNERPDLDYVFSDEDKMELDGTRLDPFFKPDWAPDLLNCLNYVTHFSVYRKAIIDDVGGFRTGFEGSQDWDLTLRVTEKTQRIAHIPRPLYSWRKVPGSAASSDRAKGYAAGAAKKALGEALDRRGLKGEVLDGPYRGYYRVKYEISGTPKVTIVIPTRDQAPMLRRCIDSIRKRSTYTDYEIVIVNNESREDETLRYFETFGGRVIDYPHPFNYSAQMNLGVEAADTDYVILLNNDTLVISPDWIEAMLEYGQRPDVGAVGARLMFPDGRVQHEGVFVGCGGGLAGHLDHGGYFGLGECVRNVSAVTAACMLVKKKVYEEVGGLDEELSVAYNDVDFCLKLREKGYEVIYTPYAQLAHREGGTRGHRHPEGNERLFRKRWPDYRDPYYNPNFDGDHPFSLKL